MKEVIKNTAITFEPEVIDMAQDVLNVKAAKHIVLMPDTHIGKGAAIGFTGHLTDRIIPNVIGVDIGCGMTMFELGTDIGSLEEWDKAIHEVIPAGFDPKGGTDKHDIRNSLMRKDDFKKMFIDPMTNEIKETIHENSIDWFLRQLGSLGSGNHFIEINVDDNGFYYLVIHSGSRGLGVFINKFWQEKAIKNLRMRKSNETLNYEKFLNKNIPDLEKRIKVAKEQAMKGNKNKLTLKEKDLAYLEGEEMEGYLQDMRIGQLYAYKSRILMANEIVNKINRKYLNVINSTHNFIEDDNIIRKGATSAYAGETLLIPLNMKDGTIVAMGKGNKEWNNSACHGAGRLMSRKKAKETINLDDFVDSMKDIYSTTVGIKTLDEAPLSYKNKDEIIKAIEPTAKIQFIIKPVLNFKGIS